MEEAGAGAFAILLLGASLSMDAMGIGVSYGMRGIHTPWPARLVMAFISMLFTGAAVGLGSALLRIIPPLAAKMVGAGMLAALGLFIIVQAFYKGRRDPAKNKKCRKRGKEGDVFNFAIQSLGITVKIMRQPVSGDFDHNRRIDLLEAVYLGIALSVDSFGVGVSSAVSGLHSVLVPVAAGLFQLLFLSAGDILGRRLALLRAVDSRIFVALSGVLLIVLAAMRYFC